MLFSLLPYACLVFLSRLCLVNAKGLRPAQIRDLVTFGDSFTDTVYTGDGGVAWPDYAAGYSKTSLHPYARAGATCSNLLTYRPFPSLFESQLPTYYNDTNHGTYHPSSTLYTLWIGTNDVGMSTLLTGDSAGVSIVDVTTCMVNWVKDLHAHGARNFLFQNIVPLGLLPQFSKDSYPTKYWHIERNTTAWNVFISELVTSGNKLADLMLKDLAPTLAHDAHLGIFDSHSLFQDMYDDPEKYLNGTAPPDVDGAAHACVYEHNSDENTCTDAEGSDKDSYLWYDELHPSEQANRIVARNIAKVIAGKRNKYTTWLS